MADVKRYSTPPFRVSFPHLFRAQAMDGGEPKFSVSAIWTPSKFTDRDKRLWKELQKALNEAAIAQFKKPLKDLPANVRRGLRDGAEKPDLEGYGEGTVFANLSTKIMPGVVNLQKERIHPEEGNEDEIYPGCIARATVTVYSYDNKGKGVSLGLMNLQKIADGERLDSRTDAADDFDDDVDEAWLEQDEGSVDDDDDEIPF